MKADWQGHTLEVIGDWTFRWLFLAPDYELLVDEESVERAGGPILRPRLDVMIEGEEGELHHVEVEILSILGMRPSCQLTIDGDVYESGRVAVRNVLNPFLVLIIIVSTGIMLYLGPEVVRRYWPFGH